MIQELERVALTVDVPAYHLKAGDMGTVVDITSDGQEFTVEFFTLGGETFAVVPVLASQIRRVGSREIAHARLMEALMKVLLYSPFPPALLVRLEPALLVQFHQR